MRFYVISDNIDTLTGMRFAGMDGEIVHTKQDTQRELEMAVNDESIGIILITTGLAALCSDFILELRKKHVKTIILEIPDRHATAGANNSISRYIQDAIGIKL